jgi:hypothetical protein
MVNLIDFELPHGYVDSAGNVHRYGRMRPATALDEVLSLQDARVQGNEAFLPIVLLARVVLELGSVPLVSPEIIGRLFAADLLYLQDLYLRLNSLAPLVVGAVCPVCRSQIRVQVAPLAG